MEYTDLKLHITPGPDGTFNVSAQVDGGGAADSQLRLPVELEDLSGVLYRVGEAIRSERRHHEEESNQIETVQQARAFGAELYDALIHGEIRELLTHTLGAISDKPDAGVRIRLTMDLKGQGIAYIASLPWELIAKDASATAFVLSKETVLVRSPNALGTSEPTPFEPPLLILVVRSNPEGTEDLDLDAEQERIQSSWGNAPGVHVDFVNPRFNELADYLADNDPHVVHYMGHGDFTEEDGGVLILEDENGQPDRVGRERLQVLFGDERRLRLVFLNACKTGTNSPDDGLDPFAGVAASLVSIGVPAVIAMQFPISDTAAVEFSGTFYRRIAAGDAVDTAVAEARKRLVGKNQAEWATPVLFMRSKDGQLFEKIDRKPSAVGSSSPSESEGAGQGEGAAPAEGFTVFLAACNDSLRHLYRRIAAGLKDDGVTVIANIPEPYDEAEHEQAVREAVREADLCVHLLGDRPGERLGEEEGRTYPLEQLKIALESARSQLVLMPEEFQVDTIEDESYRKHLQSLLARTRDPERLEFMRIGQQQMLDEIRTKRKKLENAERNQAVSVSRSLNACLDLHATD
ncbi:MAG: CHAT domain-containing protein, partial [Rhodothermales bacterium]|nr:CHAT domain-containing protein [Rhodothermales bacterium]